MLEQCGPRGIEPHELAAHRLILDDEAPHEIDFRQRVGQGASLRFSSSFS